MLLLLPDLAKGGGEAALPPGSHQPAGRQLRSGRTAAVVKRDYSGTAMLAEAEAPYTPGNEGSVRTNNVKMWTFPFLPLHTEREAKIQ